MKSYETDTLRPEYDFSKLTVVARGPGRSKPLCVELDEDVARAFPTQKDVNDALRTLMASKRQSA